MSDRQGLLEAIDDLQAALASRHLTIKRLHGVLDSVLGKLEGQAAGFNPSLLVIRECVRELRRASTVAEIQS